MKYYYQYHLYFSREFPGGPGVRTWKFHCQGPELNLWSWNQDILSPTEWAKQNKLSHTVPVFIRNLRSPYKKCLFLMFFLPGKLSVNLPPKKLVCDMRNSEYFSFVPIVLYLRNYFNQALSSWLQA